MQFTRRYTHLIVVITAYSFLILAARWAFFTQMWVILDTEQSLDGEHKHAIDKEYTIPVRTQRHVTGPTQLNQPQQYELAKKEKQKRISRSIQRHQLLQTIFTNFLHP